MYFNPRSPCGERQARKDIATFAVLFQSTLPVRGATKSLDGVATLVEISIHAPRAGSDRKNHIAVDRRNRFQSTLPVRGATRAVCCWQLSTCYFNPRSPCGERLNVIDKIRVEQVISIHAPRAGSDAIGGVVAAIGLIFQSTLPVRGATDKYIRWWLSQQISIHAPRAGSDITICGTEASQRSFQSTLPVRGATWGNCQRPRRSQ